MDLSVRKRRNHIQSLLILAALGTAGCAQPPVRTNHSFFHGLSADEIADIAHTADIVATARLESFRLAKYPDTMSGTIEWSITRCHAGPCAEGASLKTRFGDLFSTSGEFCAAREGCLERDSLQSYEGELFLVTFARRPYLEQVAGRQGTPQEGYFSLNRGYYLIKGNTLYHNDSHLLINANYGETVNLLSEKHGGGMP
jgi:hypothetical protein